MDLGRLFAEMSNVQQYSVADVELLNVEPEMQKLLLDGKKSFRAYFGKGCPVCHETGYVGRIGIFEIMLVEGEVREAVVEKKDADEIFELAVKAGMKPMMQDGVEKILAGMTSLEEVLRVIKI
jgi:type II secretory ATPase GspE/PulE/Tfp pilus assembly ATPase PilB-like protein